MELLFTSQDRQALGLRAWVLHRTSFALRRMACRISRTSVRMIDVNGPRRGVDKRCQVTVVATDGAEVVVSATSVAWHSAVNLALGRAAESLRRRLERTRRGRSDASADRRAVDAVDDA